jgi:hypothetical protein
MRSPALDFDYIIRLCSRVADGERERVGLSLYGLGKISMKA